MVNISSLQLLDVGTASSQITLIPRGMLQWKQISETELSTCANIY